MLWLCIAAAALILASPLAAAPAAAQVSVPAASGHLSAPEAAVFSKEIERDLAAKGARVGLAHVIGLGSACGVHILERSA